MKLIFYIIYICSITIAYGNNLQLSHQISLKNLLTNYLNYNMNLSIKNTENSLQKESESTNFDLTQKLALSKESKLNLNLNEKFSLKQTDNNVFDLFELNDLLFIEVLFQIPELNSPKKFNFLLMNSILYGDEQGYVVDIEYSPNGLNTTNTICDYNNVQYCNVSLQIGDFQTQNIKMKPYYWLPYNDKNIAGGYNLLSIIDNLPINMYTIYHNGNDSKLTLGSTDIENCEDDYLWIDYLKYNDNSHFFANKYYFADFEIENQKFNNRAIIMDDINKKLIELPKELLDKILKNSRGTYNYGTKQLTYDCMDNNQIPIKLHFSNNQIVQLAYNGKNKDANGKCLLKIGVTHSNDIYLGGYYFSNYCLAERLHSQFGFSKKKQQNNKLSLDISQNIQTN